MAVKICEPEKKKTHTVKPQPTPGECPDKCAI